MGNVVLHTVLCLIVAAYIVECHPCGSLQTVDITNGTRYENGSILHENIEYLSGEWYEVNEDDVVVVLGCPCIRRVCLWKCCPDGEHYINTSCGTADIAPFNPPVYKGREPLTLVASEHFYYMQKSLNSLCTDRYLVDTGRQEEELYIQENATLLEYSAYGSQWHEPGRYCVDMMSGGTGDAAPRLVAAICYPDEEPDDSQWLYIAYSIGLLLSVPFLLVTFLVYAYIPELRNLHGMCLMAYCAGLIVAYPFLAYLKMHTGEIGVDMTGCLIIAFIVYYAFQTSFFWLNVMCFDIWRTFSGYRGGNTIKRRELRRFLLYGIYAWGVPLVLTACTAGMQFDDSLPNTVIRPNFGSKRCWFHDWSSELVYFFTPVLVLVAINVTLFAVTANRIRSIRQETAILKGAESARSDKLKRDKQRYALYLKLFMVMGVNWTVELVSFAVGGSNWYWVITDLSNVLLGFFIFLIFVWKNKVRDLVRKKYLGIRAESRVTSARTDDTRIYSTSASEDAGIRLRDIQ